VRGASVPVFIIFVLVLNFEIAFVHKQALATRGGEKPQDS